MKKRNPMSATHSILPSATDSAINTHTSKPHLFYVPTTPSGKLHIFFPGSNATPDGSQKWLDKSQSLGIHTWGLMYPNTGDTSRCGLLTTPKGPYLDLFCQEVWTGTDLSPLTSVNAANSIANRLVKGFQYIIANYPTEGWETFYDGENILWENIILSGHSQGGDHVAFALKYNTSLYRAICVSSPRNLCSGIIEDWGTLDVSKIYAFTHTDDNYALQVPIYGRMGITETPVDIDTADPSTWGKVLTTSKSPAVPNAHKCTLLDDSFSDVWAHLLNS